MSRIDVEKYNEILREIQNVEACDISLREKYICLKQILERSCKELTKMESLQFPSLFSRLVFISRKYNFPQQLEWQLQNLRVTANFLLKNENNVISQTQFEQAVKVLIIYISAVYSLDRLGEEVIFPASGLQIDNCPDRIRVQVVNIDSSNNLLLCHTEEGEEIKVKYNVPQVNDIFNPTIEKIWIDTQLNLIDAKFDEKNGYLIPRVIVLEPDYLIDASALAECFQNYGESHLHYFRKKFEPVANSRHILLGNLANYFLDELVYADNAEEIGFSETFFNAFKQMPFEFTSCNEIRERSDFVEFMTKAKLQFENIKRVVLDDFPQSKINTKKSVLEPSFFCEKYGFQGRLDLLQQPEEENGMFNIVELKSGGVPFPKEDSSKIAVNHEAQTVIYRLIIQSVFGVDKRSISPTILYSAANANENMRWSASFQTLEKEILNIRNLIVATEHDLYIGGYETVEDTFRQLFDLKNYGRTPQFFIDRLSSMEKVLANATSLEKEYFYRFVSFVSRELYLQKIGDGNFESNTGTSTLWTTEFRERQETFDLISDLQIIEIDDSDNDMKIKFARMEPSNFVNFREGEICIVYPHEKDEDTILSNQILKGTIAAISNDEILVRFRYKQKNKDYLNKYKCWAIEHDKLDHAHIAMFKGLYSFLAAPPQKRNLLLGLDKPQSKYKPLDIDLSSKDGKQDEIINKALSAQDYFLIVGPPGTGKTSIFAHRLIKLFYENPNDNILVLAYTNRAVDELCETINKAFGYDDSSCDNYIRIGSELSCSELYRHRLLQNISKNVKSRDELRTIMFNKRIYVGTLASIMGKPELFDLKKFSVAIIDEASQILEPQIIGLLSSFDKFIMIGDHKQLSTITLQDELKSVVDSQRLNNMELTDCRESYFERMFRICMKNGWTHAYDTLMYQGRMHEDIVNFPNKYFYDGILRPANSWQTESLCRETTEGLSNPYQKLILDKRIAFISCKNENKAVLSDKINENEADIAIDLSRAIIDVYRANKLCFDNHRTLGIITPYRNQVALIRHKLQETGIPELSQVMVDTVERFQGSQRDIILVSFCMNKSYQLDFFSNMNREKKVDRKLNVALTRARQQLFLVGNDSVLRQNKIYNELINQLETIKF